MPSAPPAWFHGEGYRKMWARLRFAGIRTSKRRVLRLTGEHGLQAPGRVGRPHGPKAHDGPRSSSRSILVRPSASASTPLGGRALEPIRQGVRTCFGGFAEAWLPASSLATITAASASPTTSSASSPSSASRRRPPSSASPKGTVAPSGSFGRSRRTCSGVRRFATIDELRQALLAFKETYNQTWIVERHGYRTPVQVRADQLGFAQAA
jgi:putative transposase